MVNYISNYLTTNLSLSLCRFKTTTSTVGEAGVSRNTVLRRIRTIVYPIGAWSSQTCLGSPSLTFELCHGSMLTAEFGYLDEEGNILIRTVYWSEIVLEGVV